MSDQPWPTTFVIPIRGDVGDTVQRATESILEFRQYAYKNEDDCQIMCVGEIAEVDRLRDYSARHRFCPGHDARYSIYPTSD
jgi:hypothetical protein